MRVLGKMCGDTTLAPRKAHSSTLSRFLRDPRPPILIRTVVPALVLLALLVSPVGGARAPLASSSIHSSISAMHSLNSSSNGTLQCDGMYWAKNVTAWYTPSYCYGHDEPTVSYISDAAGSGGNASFQFVLPSSNSVYSQGDFYATIWIGGTVYDAASLDKQAFLEFQFYPAPPTVTGPNSGAQDCLANGAFNENWVAGTNQWFACAVVWEIVGGAEQNAVSPSPLDVYGSADQVMVLNSGDLTYVNLTATGQTNPWVLNVKDQTQGLNGTIYLRNTTSGVNLGPYYAKSLLGNTLKWGASGPGAIAFAYEIGHALNPAIPQNNPDGGCTPGDNACDSYWPGRWGSLGQMELSVPKMGPNDAGGYPIKLYFSSSQGGEAEVNSSTSGVGSTCPAPSFSTSTNCMYPYYMYRSQNYSYDFGATDMPNSTYDYGNEYEFPAVASASGIYDHQLVKSPWAWLNLTVVPKTATVEVNALQKVNTLSAQASGVYNDEYTEGPYWVNVSASGCTAQSLPVYVKSMHNQSLSVTLTCATGGTVPVSFLESGLPSGTSWSVTFNGVLSSSAGKNITFNVSSGTYPYSILTPIAGTSGVQYVLSTPSSSGTIIVGTTHITQPVVYTTQYYLTTIAYPISAGTVTPASGWHNSSTLVTLQATANPGYQFRWWTGNGPGNYTGGNNPASVSMNGPITQTADFASTPTVPVSFVEAGLPLSTTWSVTLNGATSSSTGKNITFNVTAGSYTYTIATPIAGGAGTQYIASPASGTLTVGSTHLTQSVTYTTQYQLTTSVAPAGSGSVNPSGTAYYDSGAGVTVSAVASAGYVFSGWNCSPAAACSSTSANPVTVTLTGVTSVTADFTPTAGTVPVSFVEAGLPLSTTWSVTLNGAISSSTGKNITFNVTAGSYTYTIATPIAGVAGTQYIASPASGTLTVGSTHLTQSVTYTTQYQLTTSVAPAGSGSVNPSGVTYVSSGSGISVSAIANSGYSFSGWSCAPATACSSTTADPVLVTATSVTSVTADFVANAAKVTVNFNESGLPSGTNWSVTLNGFTASGISPTISFYVIPGNYTYLTDAVISVGAGTRSVSNVTGGTFAAVSAPIQISIRYTTQYLLTTVVTPAGTGRVSPSGGWFTSGTNVSIAAAPVNSSAYYFNNWTCTGVSCYSGYSNPASITMTNPINETANFGPFYSLNFTETGLPAGTNWNLTLSGFLVTSSTSNTINFGVSSGNWSFYVDIEQISAGSRYMPAPGSGNVLVTGPTVVSIHFTLQYYVSLGASPATAGSVAPNSGWYNASVNLSLRATAFTGYTFDAWMGLGPGNYTGTTPSPTISLAGPLTEIANFRSTSSATFSVTFKESGLTGSYLWSVSLGNITRTSSTSTIVFTGLSAGNLTFAISNSTGNLGTLFEPTPSTGVISISGSTTQSVSFTEFLYLTMSSSPTSGGVVTPASGWYGIGSTLTLGATAAAGYEFTGWVGIGTGGYSGNHSTSSVVLSTPLSEVANFAPTYALTITEMGLPAGTTWSITVNGIPMSSNSASFTTNLPNGSYAYLLPPWVSGASGIRYDPTPESGVVLIAGANVAVRVNFDIQYYLAVSANPSGAGLVTPSSGWYNASTKVGLQASALQGYVFASWAGNGTGSYSGTANPVTFTIDAPVNEEAKFVKAPISTTSWIAGEVFPASAQLKIDNTIVSLSTGGMFNETVSGGTHLILASAPGYETASFYVTTMNGSGIWVKIVLVASSIPATTAGPTPLSNNLLLILAALAIAILVGLVGYGIGRRRKGTPEDSAAMVAAPQPPSAPSSESPDTSDTEANPSGPEAPSMTTAPPEPSTGETVGNLP